MTTSDNQDSNPATSAMVEARVAAMAAELETAALEVGTPEWRASFARSLELWRQVRAAEQVAESNPNA